MKKPFYRRTCRCVLPESVKECDETDACKRYFAKMFCRGRNAFARAFDYIMLRGVLYVGAYLYFVPLVRSRGIAALLSLIALAMMMLLLRIRREIAFARFVEKETERLKKLLLGDKLMLKDRESLLALCTVRCPIGDKTVLLQRALPATANDLLAALHECGGDGMLLHIYSCAGYDAKAEAFAARFEKRLTLHGLKELQQLARDAGMQVTTEEVWRYIILQRQRGRQQRRERRIASSPFIGAHTLRYVLVALLLVGASFLSRYTLYYRMLAGLCMSIAACGAVMTRVRNAPSAPELS